MKCPKCGCEDLTIDVNVVVTFAPDGNHIGAMTMDINDIHEQVASNSSEDISVFCYECGCNYPVEWNEDGSLKVLLNKE